MNQTEIELLSEIYKLQSEDSDQTFPYAGCRKLLKKAGENHEDFIPDLNTYFMEISGYCSWQTKILHWPKEKLKEVKARANKSFFDLYPKYEPLRSSINEEEMPDLYGQLLLHDRMSMALIKLLDYLLSDG